MCTHLKEIPGIEHDDIVLLLPDAVTDPLDPRHPAEALARRPVFVPARGSSDSDLVETGVQIVRVDHGHVQARANVSMQGDHNDDDKSTGGEARHDFFLGFFFLKLILFQAVFRQFGPVAFFSLFPAVEHLAELIFRMSGYFFVMHKILFFSSLLVVSTWWR